MTVRVPYQMIRQWGTNPEADYYEAPEEDIEELAATMAEDGVSLTIDPSILESVTLIDNAVIADDTVIWADISVLKARFTPAQQQWAAGFGMVTYCTAACLNTNCHKHNSKAPKTTPNSRFKDYSPTCTTYDPDHETAGLWRAARRTVGV